jgi:hypothetical protein
MRLWSISINNFKVLIYMKTFQEFILEKYYEPDQPLPSGKTPYGKATSSYYRQRGEFKRGPNRTSDQAFKMVMQGSRRSNEVSRGADNPNFDQRPDKTGKYDIETDAGYSMKVRDRKNDLEMRVRQKDQIAPGKKPVYDIEWYNLGSGGRKNPGQARNIVRNVADMWKNQVAPRIPSNSVLTNFPITNDTSERNTRSKLYSKVAGFGRPGMQGRQYASVGRNPSSRQAARGAQRITPLSGNLDPQWANRDAMVDLDAGRMHLPREDRIRLDKQRGTPRTIAPAKPSRPSMNKAVKALKSTPAIKAPAIPKPTAFKAPKISVPKISVPKIRGGGRAALAAGVVSAGLGIYSALNKPKK